MAAFAGAAHCAAVQHPLNVLNDAPAMLAACDAQDLASINNGPLAMGLLTEHDARGQERITLPRAQHEHLLAKIDWYRSQLSAAHT